MAKVRPWRWIGAALGALFGLLDALMFVMLGTEVSIGDGHNGTAFILGYYGFSFVIGGYLIGRLRENIIQMRQDSALIEAQFEALRSSQAKARHFEELAQVGRMAATVAHEVRNPLGVIRSSAGVIRERCEDDARVQRAAGFIQEESDRLADFVRQLLDYSKPFEARSVPTTFGEVLSRVDPELRARGEFRVEGEHEPLHVDAELFARVLTLLLFNAWEAGATKVVLRATLDNVEVKDNGPGMSVEVREQVFEPFFTTKATGSGLGLPLVRKIMMAHGGSVDVSSHESGTSFSLVLPRLHVENV